MVPCSSDLKQRFHGMRSREIDMPCIEAAASTKSTSKPLLSDATEGSDK